MINIILANQKTVNKKITPVDGCYSLWVSRNVPAFQF